MPIPINSPVQPGSKKLVFNGGGPLLKTLNGTPESIAGLFSTKGKCATPLELKLSDPIMSLSLVGRLPSLVAIILFAKPLARFFIDLTEVFSLCPTILLSNVTVG